MRIGAVTPYLIVDGAAAAIECGSSREPGKARPQGYDLDMQIEALLYASLSALGLALLIFGLGALAGWAWAMRSLETAPPPWIAAVMATAGAALVAGSLFGGNWLSALGFIAMFGILVAGLLRMGPWRSRSGSGGSA